MSCPARTWPARSGIELTNHEATAPPTLNLRAVPKFDQVVISPHNIRAYSMVKQTVDENNENHQAVDIVYMRHQKMITAE